MTARTALAATFLAATLAAAGCTAAPTPREPATLRTTRTTVTTQTARTAPATTPAARTPPGASRPPGGAAAPDTTPGPTETPPDTTNLNPTTPPPAGVPLPAHNTGAIRLTPLPADINPDNADQVALAGVTALLSSNTTIDADANATFWRNRAWLTDAFARQVRDAPPIAGPGAQWNTWAAHRAVLHVATTVGGDEHPPDTATTAWRQIIATITPTGPGGWHAAAFTRAVFVALTRTRLGWRIDAETG